MKNKLLHFVLDLFSASDDEEQDGIFAQVKIYRTASVRIFEYIIGILLLAIWLLIIRNIIHAAAEEWQSYLIVANLRHSQRWSQLPSQLSSIGLRSAIRQDSQRPASTLPVALQPPAVCCLCPLLHMGRLCGMDREREHLLRRNDNMLRPFGSELHILYLQDIQVAKPGRSRSPLAHYPERKTPHRRHIGVVHSCRVRSTLYSVLGQSAWSGEWIFEGLSLHSPDCRHHLGWQQILRPFPRNRQREF